MPPDGSFFHTWIQGNWVAVALETDGDLSTDHIGVDATPDEHQEYVQQFRFEFQDQQVRVFSPDWIADASFEIDDSQTPVAIAFLYEGNVKAEGILKFEDDQLVICVEPPGKERPKDFT